MAPTESVSSRRNAQAQFTEELFGAHRRFEDSVPLPGWLAFEEDPSAWQRNFRDSHGTEYVFVNDPSQLGSGLQEVITPHWNDTLLAVPWRNTAAGAMGVQVVSSAILNPRNALVDHSSYQDLRTEYASRLAAMERPAAWQALGGIQAFTGMPMNSSANYSGMTVDEIIAKTMAKARRMGDKWQYIDLAMIAAGLDARYNLGGAKGGVTHGPTAAEKRAAMTVEGQVLKQLGIHVGGGDQNTGFDAKNNVNWSDVIAAAGPHAFAGSTAAPQGYQGLGNPSPWTATGVVGYSRGILDQHTGRNAPFFLQGHGEVASRYNGEVFDAGLPVAGIVEADVGKLLDAQTLAAEKGYDHEIPLFLDRSGLRIQDPSGEDEQIARAREAGITVVDNTTEAVQRAGTIGVFAPNGPAGVITPEFANALIGQGTLAVTGAANSIYSNSQAYWLLQLAGVLGNNPSQANIGGAFSVWVNQAGVNPDQAKEVLLAATSAGAGMELESFRRGIPPELASMHRAAVRIEQLRAEGNLIGDGFDTTPPTFEPPEEVLTAIGEQGLRTLESARSMRRVREFNVPDSLEAMRNRQRRRLTSRGH